MVLTLLIATYLTSFISGVFAMAGGVILMGVLTVLLPISMAMVLHGVTQSAANGFRAFLLRKHIRWNVVPTYLVGASFAMGLCLYIAFVPEKYFVFFLLGGMAIGTMLLPKKALLNIENPFVGLLCGFLATFLQIISGVSGPLLDIFFVKNDLNRYEVIATKSLTQTFGHILKLVYYAYILEASIQWDFTLPYWILPLMVGETFLGTHAGKSCLRFVSEMQFQK
jgi:uncharacterized protein